MEGEGMEKRGRERKTCYVQGAIPMRNVIIVYSKHIESTQNRQTKSNSEEEASKSSFTNNVLNCCLTCSYGCLLDVMLTLT